MRALIAASMAGLLAACGPNLRPAVTATTSNGYVWQRHPFHDANLFLDPHSVGAQWQQAHGGAEWLDPITKTPQAVWLTSEWDLNGLPAVVREAAEQEALLVVVAYFIPNRDCGGHGADNEAHYLAWIGRVSDALGGTPAAVILEPDAIVADCFDKPRATMLSEAARRLTERGHYVYLDAGHSRWRTTGNTAERLLAAGIKHANGFSINVANRQRTEESMAWGMELSNLVGDREFVIDTSRNGIGPPPDDGWCNPEHQALGNRPTGLALPSRAAALLWIKRPGESDGPCGGESGFDFSPAQAGRLIANAEWVPTDTRQVARLAVPDPPAPQPTPTSGTQTVS